MSSCGLARNPSAKRRTSLFNKLFHEILLTELKNITVHNLAELPPSPVPVVYIPLDALAIQPSLRDLQRRLSDDVGSGLIGITAPGGMGKTTLLKVLNNEFLSSSKYDFHVVIFASVPHESSRRGLQEVIARRLGLPWGETESQEDMAVRIYMSLKKKRFLLLLDDLHVPLDLSTVGIPSPINQSRSRVVFTTRSESVCRAMNAEVLRAKCLDPRGSWQLFQRCAGEVSSQPDIVEVARNICSECEGLPLGLVTVARAMASVMTREEWIWRLETLKNLKELISSEEQGTEFSALLPLLYFSYQMLSSKRLRKCLLYCSLFPENHSINKEELISYWMGEGFLVEQRNVDRARSEGNELIAKLKALGMLQDGDDPTSEVRMHDVMRRLALGIIKKNDYFVQAGMELTKIPKLPDRSFKAERVSFMNNSIEAVDQLPIIPHLKTLILKRNFPLERIRHDSLLFKAWSLRILDLSHTRIREIPRGIGGLALLRHLDLSFTKIKELPAELGKLDNLVQLLLEGARWLARIPADVIPKLSKLLVLNLYASYGEWEFQKDHGSSASIEELKYLQQLRDLGITIRSSVSLESFLKLSRKLTNSTRRLLVKECEDLQYLRLSKSRLANLQQLAISDCTSVEKLILGGRDDCSAEDATEEEINEEDERLLHLEVLHLRALYRAEVIFKGVASNSSCLPMLRELDISFCHELRNLSWVLELNLLEHVKLDTCLQIEHVVQGSKEVVGKSLPRLRNLSLQNLPQLKYIFDQPLNFPSLEFVKVLSCPKLRSLPKRTEYGVTPVFISGEFEWWNALDWKSGKEKHSSFWYFRAANELS